MRWLQACPARLARCCTNATRCCNRGAVRAFAMQLQLAVLASAAGFLPNRWSLARGLRRMDASVGEPLRTHSGYEAMLLASHGFWPRGERRTAADGAIVNYGDIKLVPCDTPPPRRLLHQQVACGSLQGVLRAARARKGLRRMLRAERRRGACQLGVLGRVVELEDEHRARRVALHDAAVQRIRVEDESAALLYC